MNLVGLLLVCSVFSGTSVAINVAIIGGGIGGASTAYFLNQIKPKSSEINVDIFESNKIGGRLATIEFENNFYENGGSIIHEKNFYMSKFVEDLKLEKNTLCAQDFGIFSGQDLIFKSSKYDTLTLLKLLWRYGLDVFRLKNYIDDLLSYFSRIYDSQKSQDYPFESTNAFMHYINPKFLKLLNMSSFDGFMEKGFSNNFIQEVIGSIIRCNYCQSTKIHNFVGAVAVAGAGSNLWSVKGGNWIVAERLISASGANVIYEKVKSVSMEHNNKILVSTTNKTTLYDYVVIATPLTHKSDITFHGFHDANYALENYHTTVCTFVKGSVNQQFFHTFNDPLPDVLLFTSYFTVNALAKVHSVNGDCDSNNGLWKIFSDSKLIDADLKEIFESYSVISTTEWLAYPEYGTQSKNKSFYLFKNVTNLLYVNAIETLASAMEMSAIGAHNIATLIIRDLKNHPESRDLLHDEL